VLRDRQCHSIILYFIKLLFLQCFVIWLIFVIIYYVRFKGFIKTIRTDKFLFYADMTSLPTTGQQCQTSEWVSVEFNVPLDACNKSFQRQVFLAIDCIGTDNQCQKTEVTAGFNIQQLQLYITNVSIDVWFVIPAASRRDGGYSDAQFPPYIRPYVCNTFTVLTITRKIL